MNKVLLVAEHDGRHLNPSTAKAVSCALALGDADITVAVFGDGIAPVGAEAARLSGIARVHLFDAPGFAPPVAEVLAPVVVSRAAGCTHVLAPATTFGKDLLPRVAALLDVPMVSDIMAVESPRRFRRPVYAGSAILTLEVPTAPVVAGTVRIASFEAVDASGDAPVETVAAALPDTVRSRVIAQARAPEGRPDLQTARRVVSGGRALGSAANFRLVHELAEVLGAAVGASRAAVDAGYAPNDLQVGQTGKIIAPELYVALGISGAIQHMTGIKDARTIVAINNDADAPIFEYADYGLVGDLFELVPELQAALRRRGSD